jgi:excisionase family DNA binding protein
MNQVPDDELLTVDEAATLLKVDVETVRRWLRSGHLRGLKFGRMWRIPASALLAIAIVPELPSAEVSPSA